MAAQPQQPQSNFPSTSQTFRILVENRHVGGLIGKAGVNMKTLQSETGMQCSIRKAASEYAQERVMVVRGTGADFEKGVAALAQLYLSAAPQRQQQQQAAAAPANSDVSIRIIVHGTQVGAIIGKGGVTITDMRQGTQARINVASEPLPQSTDQLVTVTGTPAVVAQGVLRVIKQLFENPVRAGTQSIEYVPGSNNMPDVPSSSQVSAAALPPTLQQALAQWLVGQQPAQHGVGAAASVAALPRRGGRQPRAGAAATAADAPGNISHTFLVPTKACGTVIGRNGENVKAIRSGTGCTIMVHKAEPGSPEHRLVTITGSQQSVLTATARVQQLVAEVKDE